MKLKPNFIPRSLCTSILAKFFFASIHLLLAFIQSHINVCLLFSEYFKNILMLIAAQARGFYFEAKACAPALGRIFYLKCHLLVNGCSVYTK